MVVYPAEFEDARGRARTEIHNDGSELALSLRGVEFVGSDFDALAPTAAHLDRARERFTLNAGELCACRLEWTMPLLVEGELDGRRQVEQATLSARLQLGTPTAKGALAATSSRSERAARATAAEPRPAQPGSVPSRYFSRSV